MDERSADYNDIIESFIKNHGIHKVIAISGGSDAVLNGVPEDDPLQAQYQEFTRSFEERIIDQFIGKLRGYLIAILTGGTKWGVPKTATIIAKKYGIKTIGIYPLVGKKYALGDNLLDLSICVEPQYGASRWGDESPIFTNLLDSTIVFSGSAGTLVECAHILKINEDLRKKNQPLKYIVPISGTGGVADGLSFIWAKPEIRSECMPNFRVQNGFQAADIIREKLTLDDYLSEYV